MVHLEIEDIEENEQVEDTQIRIRVNYILSLFFCNTLRYCAMKIESEIKLIEQIKASNNGLEIATYISLKTVIIASI